MNSRKKQVLRAVLSAALVGAAFTAYIGRDAVFAAFSGVKLAPSPERFTELYFANPNSLPGPIVKNQTFSFSFVIRNVEGETTTYPYAVYLEPLLGNRITLATNTIILADGASTSINVSYAFGAAGVKGEVVVDLLTQNDQRIDFLLP